MKKRKVSEQIIRRLPRYYRYLEELSDNGVTRISSKELGEMMSPPLTKSGVAYRMRKLEKLARQDAIVTGMEDNGL